MGVLHNIYESVENLNGIYMKSKDFILEPPCPAETTSVHPLLFNHLMQTRHGYFYKCSTINCPPSISEVYNAICPTCKKGMTTAVPQVNGLTATKSL